MLHLGMLRYVAMLVVFLGGAAAPSSLGPGEIDGKYDLAGTAHVSISPFPTHEYPGRMTATLSGSRGPGGLSLRLEARGYACTLQVSAALDGSLQFPDGATCPLSISEPDARGHVDARLRTARGRVLQDRLEMVLRFDVNGSVQMRIPSRTIRILGAEIQSPATWAPSAPVHGTVDASGQGARLRPDAGVP